MPDSNYNFRYGFAKGTRDKPFYLPADFVCSVQPYRHYTHCQICHTQYTFLPDIQFPVPEPNATRSPYFFPLRTYKGLLTRPRSFTVPFRVNLIPTANHKLKNDFRPRTRKTQK